MTKGELLYKLIMENNYKKACEVGTGEGGTAGPLIEKATGALDCFIMIDRYIPKKLYAILLETDTPPYLLNKEEGGYQRNPLILMRMDSLKAAEVIGDKSLDLVFLDAQHEYEAVKKDIKAWTPKVKEGGIMCGHDYNPDKLFTPGANGVGKAVNEYFGEVNLEHDSEDRSGDNHMWWIKINGKEE